jgi:hypothetical protein
MGARVTNQLSFRTHCLVPALLLSVLLGGLGITALTRHWLGSVPFHDHLILGPVTAGWEHHPHDDEPEGAALRWVEPGAAASSALSTTRVVSIGPAGAGVVSEFSSFTMDCLGVELPRQAQAERGPHLPLTDQGQPAGWLAAPPSPPPRPR